MNEPELTLPAPRAVRRRPGHGSLITFVHIFILPHTVVGIAGVFVVLGMLGMLLFGERTVGTVVNSTAVTSKKNGTSWTTELSFTIDGRTERTTESLREFHAVGSTVPLRVISLGGDVRAQSENELPFILGFGFFFITFWNAVMFAFHWRLTFLPLRYKRLVREGYVASGRVTKREEIRGSKGRISYKLSYDYSVEGIPLSGEMNVLKDDYASLSEGSVVTVLVSETKPNQSVIYRCAPYEAVLHS